MKRFLITLCLCLSLLCTLPFAASAAEEAATAEAAEVEEGFFLLLYEHLGAHLPELFSALSLLSAFVLAFCYKKGLLPLLREGIGAIGSATKDWGTAAEKCAKQSEEICKNANDSIHFIQNFAEGLESSLAEIEKKLAAVSDQNSERERLRLLMEGQVELLQDIFLSSSLPQFEKDRVCKRVEAMRLALCREASEAEVSADEKQ